jgi:hypothetical protein
MVKRYCFSEMGAPQTVERFNQSRSTINVDLGAQKDKSNRSMQAIQKWKDNLVYMDDNLLGKVCDFED